MWNGKIRRSRPGPPVHRVEWMVKAPVRGSGSAVISVVSEKGGRDTKKIELR